MKNVTQSEFAQQIGMSKAYVTKLKQSGRLVMDEKGRVLVKESKDLIEQTKSPDKQSVADRHQQSRQQHDLPKMDDMETKIGSPYHQARAMKEKYNAMQAKIAYEKEMGQLLSVNEVKACVMESDTVVRNRLESFPDKMAPLLAMQNDEQKIRALLIDQIEYMLGDLSRSIKKLEIV